jgi:hypothetical protein
MMLKTGNTEIKNKLIEHRTNRIGGALRRSLAAASVVVLGMVSTACTTTADPIHYADQKPALDLRQYFNGTLDAHGMFQDRSGTIIKRFAVVMTCRWEGDVGTFDEAFTYSDGTTQRRVWTIRKTGDGRYVGTASDVIGEADGVTGGNTLRWRYTLALPVDGKIVNVQLEDWMILMDDRVMLNRAVMRKWGVHVGDVTLSFTKRL